MNERTFRTVLFCVLLSVFSATAILVLLSLGNWVQVDPEYKRWMFAILIVEVVASVLAFWKQLTGVAFLDPPDLNGEWEYVCIKDDASYKHGGKCTITVKRAPFGWEFLIRGQRMWMAHKLDGEWRRQELEAPASWENTWGTFTGEDALRYAYSVKAGDSLVQGYGWASIRKDQQGKATLLEGNFYQLPPHDPFYGFQQYTRVAQSAGAEGSSTKSSPVAVG
jgi:hypothetical protein